MFRDANHADHWTSLPQTPDNLLSDQSLANIVRYVNRSVRQNEHTVHSDRKRISHSFRRHKKISQIAQEFLCSLRRGNGMHIFVTDFDGHEHKLEALEGWRVMEIIRDWGLPMKAECGGACACGTCHVHIDPEWVDRLVPAHDDELEQLDTAADVQPNSRLSCQILMGEDLDGLRLRLAAGSETATAAVSEAA
jgi:ferredoxin, 2Fe-2S